MNETWNKDKVDIYYGNGARAKLDICQVKCHVGHVTLLEANESQREHFRGC